MQLLLIQIKKFYEMKKIDQGKVKLEEQYQKY